MTVTNGNMGNGHHLLTGDPNWWRQAVVYQIYPRSFADANGDGIGDLKGITSRVPYLKELGIDAVWLSPFYPSALKDGGYDVADYRDVDPKIGTLDDFDEMSAAFKAAGIKVIVDIVPNHSSDDHVWFQEALKAGRGSKERERYIFKDGKGENGELPPSDWTCTFGGPAWDRVEDGQWYLHIFDSSQPDFNWDHPEVRADFIKTLRFWGDRGVAGFRIDVAHGLVKDMSEPLLSLSQAEIHALTETVTRPGAQRDIHPYWDRDEVLSIYQEWRKVFDEYDPPLTAVAEAWVATDRKHLYASAQGLGQAFSFDMLMAEYSHDDFKETIQKSLDLAQKSGSSSTWVFSNHDMIRHATRYGIPRPADRRGHFGFAQFCRDFLFSGGKDPKCDFELGLRRARAATLMLLALPGSAYIYQGEELGLPEVVEMPASARQDPSFFRTNGADTGRDGCRVPIPWTRSGPTFGFGPGPAPAHLPQPEWFGDFSVEALDKVDGSTLNMYRSALQLRRELQGAEVLEWLDGYGPDVLAFKRAGGWVTVMNFGESAVQLRESGDIVVCSAGELKAKMLPQDTTVWIKGA